MFFFSAFSPFASNPPWKKGLQLKKEDYLPVPPVFIQIKQEAGGEKTKDVFVDALTYREDEQEIDTAFLYKSLNRGEKVNEYIKTLKDYCEKFNLSKACLGYGRIHEFGAYNQTEDHEIAKKYYTLANNSISQSLLSFYHRTYEPKDYLSSVVENQNINSLTSTSVTLLESALSQANQHQYGKLLPNSCSSAASILGPIAKATQEMKFVYNVPHFNETYLKKIETSETPDDMYIRAMLLISNYYPSIKERKKARELLIKSIQGRNSTGAAALSYILLFEKQEDPSNEESKRFFDEALSIALQNNDCAAYHLQFLLNCDRYEEMQQIEITEMEDNLYSAKKRNYAPALDTCAERTKETAASDGTYKMLTKAYELGYIPAAYHKAERLINGNGVVADCDAGVETYRKVIETGPWSEFFNMYVRRGSEHAYLKMIDLGLTPEKEVKTDKIIYEEAKRGLSYLVNKRESRRGETRSLVWLALSTNITESMEYLDKMKTIEPAAQMIEPVLRAYVVIKNMPKYIHKQLSSDDSAIIAKYTKPVSILFVKTIAFTVFVIMISMRVKVALK